MMLRVLLGLLLGPLLAVPAHAATQGASGGHTVQDEGADLAARGKLNCIGTAIACTDDSGNNATKITISAAGGTPAANLYVAGHLFPGELQNTVSGDWKSGADCKLSGCLLFDGTDAYVKVLGKDGASGGWSTASFDGWIYTTTVADSATQTILHKRGHAGTPSSYTLTINPSGVGDGGKIAFFSTGIINARTTNIELTANTWYHIEYVYDNTIACGIAGTTGKLKIYVNGVAKAVTETSCTGGSLPTVADELLRIGANQGDSNYFSGRLDEVRIWSQANSSTDVTAHYNSGSGAACSGAETGLVLCFHLNDGVDDGTGTIIAKQAVVPASAGSDANDCLTTSTPCRTIAAALAKIPTFFSGSATLHLASGTFVESSNVTYSGRNPDGDYSLTTVGYINATSNSFTDAEFQSGTSSGSNTANFPLDTKSLFNDTTLTQFTTAGDYVYQILRITGGTGYCAGADMNNWHLIEKQNSTSQLSVVTTWSLRGSCSTPGADTTYKIYLFDDMATIHGSNLRTTGINVLNSSGLTFQKVRMVKHTLYGMSVERSSISRMDLMGSDYNGTTGTTGNGYWFRGVTYVDTIWSSRAYQNTAQGFVWILGATSQFIDGCVSDGHPLFSGFMLDVLGTVFYIRDTLASNNTAHGGIDAEYNGSTPEIRTTRLSNNLYGLIVSAASAAWFSGAIAISDNTSHGIYMKDSASVNRQSAVTVEIKNNGGWGVNASFGAFCPPCNLFTYSGNASGTYTADVTSLVYGTSPSHVQHMGSAPSVSACGTTPSIVGTDNGGKVTVGSGSVTACTLTFATAWANAPACVVMNETTEQTLKSVSTTTTLGISSATAFTSDVIAYFCVGRL